MEGSIRLAVLEDPPAARLGLERVIACEQDLQVVGVTSSKAELWPLLCRTRPQVVVLDLARPSSDELDLCLEIERWPQRPGVAICTTVADDTLALAGALAGVGAVLAESSSPVALLEAIRVLARAPRTLQSVSWRTACEVAARLDPSDHAIFAMRLAGDPPARIGAIVGVSADAVSDRIRAIIASIRPVVSAVG
jgi:DNA-binding NarL/FixJ family response regulator